jgi:hypothetical protein
VAIDQYDYRYDPYDEPSVLEAASASCFMSCTGRLVPATGPIGVEKLRYGDSQTFLGRVSAVD